MDSWGFGASTTHETARIPLAAYTFRTMTTTSQGQPAGQTWTTRALLQWITGAFEKKGIDSPRLCAELILAHVLGCDRMRLYMDVDRPASEIERGLLRKLVSRALEDEPVHRARLIEITKRVRAGLIDAGWEVAGYDAHPTPIVPLVCGSNEGALGLAGHLREVGIHAPAIRPPSVPAGTARVRMSLRADLTDDEVGRILRVLSGEAAVGHRETEKLG